MSNITPPIENPEIKYIFASVSTRSVAVLVKSPHYSMIYAFYLFNRDGIFLYSEEWNRTKPESNRSEEQKLLFGLLFSLKGFAEKLSNKDGCAMHSYKTGAYKLHLFDTITGLKFVITTDASVPDLRENLKFIHSGIYIEQVCKNPCQAVGSPVTTPGFAAALNKYVRSLPFFNAPPAL